MADKDGFRARVNWAFRRLQQRAFPAKVKQEDLAERVGRRLKREFSQPTGNRWLTGAVPRDLETMEALADELDVDPGWLYFERGTFPEGLEPLRQSAPPDRFARGKKRTAKKTVPEKKEAS